MFSFAFSEQIRNADCPVYTEIRGGRPIHGNDNDDNDDDEQAVRYKQIISVGVNCSIFSQIISFSYVGGGHGCSDVSVSNRFLFA